MIRFILNDQSVKTAAAPGSTLLDFVRYTKRLMGTKIGCREGDCGACTILVGEINGKNVQYRSATSCLMPLGNADGKHIVTVEGINMNRLNPAQQMMVDENGTQCGFCTPGFIMSMTGFMLEPEKGDKNSAIAAVDGNICRCTGYKSIERACNLLATSMQEKPSDDVVSWLTKMEYIPSYFAGIHDMLSKRDEEVIEVKEFTFDIDEQTGIEQNGELFVGGGTDLIVQKPLQVKRNAATHVSNSVALKGIKDESNMLTIGGAVTVTEFLHSPIVQKYFTSLPAYMKLVSSTPIRNMATLAGNIVNASPIGDMTIFFLALQADLVLWSASGERTIPLQNFYTGYKQKEMKPWEILAAIRFPVPAPSTLFHFEKVSKRTHLDIATVNSACSATIADDHIDTIHISAGGVAAFPKYLQATSTFLSGKKLETQTLKDAFVIMNDEISPISDARGSADYKRLLLRQLCICHLLKFFGPAQPLKDLLHQ